MLNKYGNEKNRRYTGKMFYKKVKLPMKKILYKT